MKRNAKKGTAKLTVVVPGPGELTLGGRGTVPIRSASAKQATRAVDAAGTVSLTIKAKGKQRKRLTKTGKVKVQVTFTASGGNANTETKKLKLLKNGKRKR